MLNYEADEILKGIIERGGTFGSFAKLYLGDKEKTKRFIIECSEHTHHVNAQEFWGSDLVNKINSFAIRHRDVKSKT